MKKLLAGVLAIGLLAASSGPAFGDDEGTVSAQVTAAAPCIQVTPATLDFGTLGFSQSQVSFASASRPLDVTNCGAAIGLLGRGSDATSTSGAAWDLDTDGELDCPTTDRYVQRVDTGGASVPLHDTSDTNLRALGAGEVADLGAIVVMPCVGSSGAGQVMTFSYTFTAVLA